MVESGDSSSCRAFSIFAFTRAILTALIFSVVFAPVIDLMGKNTLDFVHDESSSFGAGLAFP